MNIKYRKSGAIIFNAAEVVTYNLRFVPAAVTPRAVRIKKAALAAYALFGQEFGPCKDQWRTLARMAFIWAMRQEDDPPSYAVLSRLAERRSHKAALYLFQRAEALRESDEAFRGVTDRLLKL